MKNWEVIALEIETKTCMLFKLLTRMHSRSTYPIHILDCGGVLGFFTKCNSIYDFNRCLVALLLSFFAAFLVSLLETPANAYWLCA